ncbi:MAG: TIGR04551 family protein [Deltaproteobacteria bacterium]|nr:TIGR04551 family protein [Deltaproteobacteria bacterium]
MSPNARSISIAALSISAVFVASSVSAQTSTSSADREALKKSIASELEAELRGKVAAELKAQLLEELRGELAADAAKNPPANDQQWSEEEWKWEEPVKPEVNFLDLHGYFRFRYDFFKNLDLGTYRRNRGVGKEKGVEFGPFSPGYSPPVPLCNTDSGTDDPDPVKGRGCAEVRGAGSSLGGANMRLRLNPVFNVYEDIKIKTQIDVLDNLVLGSTPDGFPQSDSVPLLAFSQSQHPPSDGVNALFDSVRVRRVWAEILTPLGQIRVGRMPSSFGLGILANPGDELDDDYGDSNDRIMFVTKIANHFIVPAFDWTVSGPTSGFYGSPQGQPFDRDQRDDVDQFILAVARRDDDQQIREKLENDQAVVNYGTYLVYRTQALDAANYYASADPNSQSSEGDLIVRDAEAFAGSLWFKLIRAKLKLELEGALIAGTIGNPKIAGGIGASEPAVDILQWGGAANAEYKLLHDALTLRLLVAVASGDKAPGWGVRPLTDSAPVPGSWDGAQYATGSDSAINNYRFDPDFKVDLILWRQLVGMITDAIVVRPGVQYNLTEGFGLRADFVYSRAMFAESTPSASHAADANLGLEGDLKIFYSTDDGFHAWLEYGLLFPFAGLESQVTNEEGRPEILDTTIAQTIQAMLAVTF